MNKPQVNDMRLLYESVYNEDLREQVYEYNNTVYTEDIVEVATEYFYSYGLNSDGIDILVEKVGLESFVEFVYDLSEDLHVLTEARSAKKRSGRESYDDVLKKINAKEAAKKAAKKAATQKVETEKAKPETRGPESQAKSQQPKSQKPVRDAIARNIFKAIQSAGDAYKAGVERHKAATQKAGDAYRAGVEKHNAATTTAGHLAKETGKTVGKAAEIAGQFGKGFGSGVGIVAKAGKRLIGEEFEYIDYLTEENLEDIAEEVIYEMLDEGYNFEDIEDIFVEIISEARVTYGHDTEKPASRLDKAFKGALGKVRDAVNASQEKARESAIASSKRASERGEKIKKGINSAKQQAHVPVAKYASSRNLMPGAGLKTQSSKGRKELRSAVVGDVATRVGEKIQGAASKTKKGLKGMIGSLASKVASGASRVASRMATEEVDIYDIILSHLLDEGYAESVEQAEVIMVNMSEEWRHSILEATVVAQQSGVPGTVQVKPEQQGGIGIGPIKIGATTANKTVPGSFKAGGVSDTDAARYNTKIDNPSISAAERQSQLNRSKQSGFIPLSNPSSIPDTGIPGRPSPGRAEDQTRARTKGY
jgi:hypothetical protein